MAVSEQFAERARKAAEAQSTATGFALREKRMFGGLAFMLADKMFVGVIDDELMVRVGAAAYEESLARPHTREQSSTALPHSPIDALLLQSDALPEAVGGEPPIERVLVRGEAGARSLGRTFLHAPAWRSPSARPSTEVVHGVEEVLEQDRDRTADGVGVGEVRDSCTGKGRDETLRIAPVSPQRRDGSCRDRAGERRSR